MTYQRQHRREVTDDIETNEYESQNFHQDREKMLEMKYGPALSCLKCSHFKTCFLYRNEVNMIQSQYGMLEKKDWPNLPEDRAKICKYYEYQTEQTEQDQEFQNENA